MARFMSQSRSSESAIPMLSTSLTRAELAAFAYEARRNIFDGLRNAVAAQPQKWRDARYLYGLWGLLVSK